MKFKTVAEGVTVAALLSTTIGVQAQESASSWPSKPVKYVVPFSPGGVSDNVARRVAQHLKDRLNQTVVVENKPGLSGIVGTRAVAHADSDGYTVMGGTITTHAVAAVVAMPVVQQRLRAMGVEPDVRTPAAFAEFQRAEMTKWSKVIKDAGIQAE